MVKSNSCFKIITCGSDSADNDDLDAPQRNSSSDKRGWSFGKKSARHRVLESSVSAETPTSGHVKTAESAPIELQSPASASVPDKLSDIQCTDEKPQLLAPEAARVSATERATVDQSKVDDELYDQSKEVDVKLEDQDKDDNDKPEDQSTEFDVKLDESAVVDVQTDCGGSLAERSPEELKNVVKLQAAVRGHLVRRQAVGTLRCVQAIVKMQALVRSRQSVKKDNHDSKTLKSVNYISIEKLLSNSFARQLLESTPKNQPIHVKCDPSKPDSAWKWLETWMAVSTKDTPDLNEAVTLLEQESVSSIKVSTALSESEESLITNDANNLNTVCDNSEQLQVENTNTSDMKETAVEINLADADSNMEFIALSPKPVMETEQPKRSMKRSPTELLETDERKSVSESRNVTYPAPTSTTDATESFDSCLLEASSKMDSEVREKEAKIPENPVVPHTSQLQVGSSDCGTEISISSTLDSPDMSDAGVLEHERHHDLKVSEEIIFSPNNTTNNDFASNIVAELEKIDGVNGESMHTEVALVSPQTETKPERTTPDEQREYDDTAASMQAYGSEASPRSHMTVPESQQGTPSSLVSGKEKRSKADKSGSDKKSMALPTGKKSSSNPNLNSASSKDHKNGKRRQSLGSPKPDQADQEPRDSSSSSPYIPRFMQVTESARAKLQPTTSPRSSPDVQDRDLLIKKRHSLPGVNGKQGSPRIPAKGTTESKWQR